MYLTNRFSRSFAKPVRQRGQQYFYKRLVKIGVGNKEEVRAVVTGSDKYDVSLKRVGDELMAACTCPYFDEDFCKHIFATMLAAEQKEYLIVDGKGPTRLVMSDEFLDDDDLGNDGDYWDKEERARQARIAATKRLSQGLIDRPPSMPPAWQLKLRAVSQSLRSSDDQTRPWPASRELFYLVDVRRTLRGSGLAVSLAYREMKRTGEWGKIRTTGRPHIQVLQMPEPDRQILALFIGAREYYSYAYSNAPDDYQVLAPLDHTVMPLICKTGRCRLLTDPSVLSGSKPEMLPLDWDDGEPWEFWLELRSEGNNLLILGALRRNGERMELREPDLLTPTLVFARGRVARFNSFSAFAWINELRAGPIHVPSDKEGQILEELLKVPRVPPLDLPKHLRFDEVNVSPKLRLRFKKLDGYWRDLVGGELSFDYDGVVINAEDDRTAIVQSATRRLIPRDRQSEQLATDRLERLGFVYRSSYDLPRPFFALSSKRVPSVVRLLTGEGWLVEAEGNIYRQARQFHMEVTSGIDWFELHGTVDFGDAQAHLPELIAALTRGDSTVLLGDGTIGLLPEDWLKKYALLAGFGSPQNDHLRFTRSQVGFLDALLASQPEVNVDKAYSRARNELLRFDGIKPQKAPPTFNGKLRGYQEDGLGWLGFLQRFGFGGCLADDMGLGKTVQVLALLESRRRQRLKARNALKSGTKAVQQVDGVFAPSLVVVPKSLVFNWKQEAAKFTPNLRILDHTGMNRNRALDSFDDYDLVVTTYGTLRRDAIYFKDAQFDYLILDEAQAVKNANTESAKATRLLRGSHRLALSGTPIENHLGELWSLFEFLNPGLLGSSSTFKLNTSSARNPDEQTRGLLAKALRPFILRRTKQEVAKDLPAKTEQTIYCEMEPVQRRLYDELRDHYRRSLLGLIEREGIMKSKIQILESLLRLRQAACHTGLIDKSRLQETSAKLEVLLPHLNEVLDEGHKALVFSQFTSFLAILRDRLDRDNVSYEYLDGKTRDRASCVERFQNDSDCKLFLISLKAGGLGLNLTSADYVFLLDPWWNPAVETQAIDRAHRIGQSRQVFAYRLIARDTVEEKVLELQRTKRDLADAIINADNSLIRRMDREDLDLLLS